MVKAKPAKNGVKLVPVEGIEIAGVGRDVHGPAVSSQFVANFARAREVALLSRSEPHLSDVMRFDGSTANGLPRP